MLFQHYYLKVNFHVSDLIFMSLKVNSQAPDFILPSTEDKSFTLSKDADGKPVVLYFYPKDFTGICTKEACGFRDEFAAFRDPNVTVYGISTDSTETHRKFRQEYQLPFHLLADEKGAVSKLYKAKIPLLNISKRITYLLDKEHRIKAVYQDFFHAEEHIKAMIEVLSKN
jgi:peroxiredoxin Q/BCP